MSTDPNSREAWDAIWLAEGEDTWRTYPKVFNRIVQLVPDGASVYDIGCGVGKLLDRLKAEKNCKTEGLDISPRAAHVAHLKGHNVYPRTFDALTQFNWELIDVVIATEVLEHFDTATIESLLTAIGEAGKRALFAVPNNCMGPDEEPQHQQKWTAIAFKQLLQKYFKTVRVECIDDGAPRLLGVCNWPDKRYKLAFTMPVKNEAADIERVLKSFRGAADYVIIGVDDTSNDATEEIARRYADEVFHFTWENDFSKARNACIEQCRKSLINNEWIFMSEGHEHLESGLDELLNLDQVLISIHVLEVRREDRDHAWMFPWLFRNRPEIYFENAVHNTLVYDEQHCGQMPAVRTWHEASTENRQARTLQRRYMNRQALLETLAANPSDARSCYYLANEWRTENPEKAIMYYQRYLGLQGRNGPERYQARLSMAQCLAQRVRKREAEIKNAITKNNYLRRLEFEQQADMQCIYDTLIQGSADDWSRNEHWLALGDLCAYQPDRLEQALRFYELAAVSIGREPLTFMWLEKANYSWVPAQKLVTTYAQAGMLTEALHWCERVAELLPEWSPQEAHDEVEAHRCTIIEKLEASRR